MGQVQALSLDTVDFTWFIEFAIITLSWVILRHSGSLKAMAKPRNILEAVLLFLILSYLTLFSNVIISGESYFLLIRLFAQSVITSVYLFHFSAWRKKTKLLLWLAMTTASMSIFHMAGQCSLLLASQNASGAVQGAARIVIHLSMIAVALRLRGLRDGKQA